MMEIESDNSEDSSQIDVPATVDQIPETSRKKYEGTYNKFIEWKQNKNIQDFTEKVMLTYFQELSQTLRSSTLWSFYSILKVTIKVNHNIDISRYKKLKMFLKQCAKGYEARKSKLLTQEEIQKFINTAPDDKYLLMKVALIIGTVGGLRNEELSKLKVDNMQDLGTAVLIRVPEKSQPNNIKSCILTDKYYQIYKKYANLRPPNVMDGRFFLSYKNGKCTRNVTGINQFGRMAKHIASFLRLENPQLYTGHCLRKSSKAPVSNDQANINRYLVYLGTQNQSIDGKRLVPILPKPVSKAVENVTNVFPSKEQNINDKDEFSTFGEYVSNELRNLKNRRILLETKQKINAILFEAQMKGFQNEIDEQSLSNNSIISTIDEPIFKTEPIDLDDLKEEPEFEPDESDEYEDD